MAIKCLTYKWNELFFESRIQFEETNKMHGKRRCPKLSSLSFLDKSCGYNLK